VGIYRRLAGSVHATRTIIDTTFTRGARLSAKAARDETPREAHAVIDASCSATIKLPAKGR
jgi:hypothetical protein